MRRYLLTASALLAVSLGLFCGGPVLEAASQGTHQIRMRLERFGGRVWPGRTNSSLPPLALSKTYDWSTPSSLTVLKAKCIGDATCVAACGVGWATGSATNWECIDNTGAQLCAVGTVNPGLATVINSPIAGVKALDITAANQAPSIVCEAISAVYSGDPEAGTTIMWGYGRASGREGGLNWWFNGYAGGATCYSQIYLDTTGAEAGAAGFWASPSYPGHGANPSAVDGWATIASRTDGTVGGVAGATNVQVGIMNTAATASGGYACLPGVVWTFGGNSGTHFLNGPLGAYYLFNTNKSATQVRAIHDALQGFGGTLAGPLASIDQTATVQGDPVDNSTATGNVDNMWTLDQIRDGHESGLRTYQAHRNVWAADPLAAATWTAVGTPTTTSNVSAGPFAVWKKANEEDLIVDDSAAAFEGYRSLEASTYMDGGAYYFNATCFLKAGTSGTTTDSACLTFTSDGTYILRDGGTSGECCFPGSLTTTSQRFECVARVTGATTVKANVLVGSTAAQTGSIRTAQCQITEGPNIEQPLADNTARGNLSYSLAPGTDSWPNAALGGAIEIVSTPLWDSTEFVSDQAVGDSTYYEFDAYLSTGTPSADHTMVMVYDYGAINHLLVGFGTGNVSDARCDLNITGLSRVHGVDDVTRGEWRALGGGLCNVYAYHDVCAGAATSCYATTLVASNTTGTCLCPGNPDVVRLGNRLNGVAPTSAAFQVIRIYTP